MSTMFRLKYLLGFIPSAKKIDADWAELMKMHDELNALENSKEIKRCGELSLLVKSYDFQIQKKEIQNQNYQGSPEIQLINEFDKLGRSKSIREYFKLLKSDQLPRFHKAESSQELNRFHQLKKKIESAETSLSRKDPDYKEYKQLSKDREVVFYTKFRNSYSYTNYVNTRKSYELERYEELKKITADPEFVNKVAWLKNKNRYASTDLYKQEAELKSLESSALMRKYLKLKTSSKLDFFKEWSVVFEDNFGKNAFDKSRWQPENYWGYKTIGKSFSQANEAQCYNGEKNISIDNNTLSILIKKERLKGQFWNAGTGLMPKEFEYSSGIINSAESFRFKEGIVEAKVKFLAVESLTSAFSLTGSNPMPQIDIFRSGKNCVGLGYTEKTAGGVIKKYKQIHGLDFSNYHIFSLEKKDHTLIWKINGIQAHQEYYDGADESLFLNFVTSLHEPVKSQLIPHRFQIDWVRCYEKKN
jgi:beta-glucanase (GH16 family)